MVRHLLQATSSPGRARKTRPPDCACKLSQELSFNSQTGELRLSEQAEKTEENKEFNRNLYAAKRMAEKEESKEINGNLYATSLEKEESKEINGNLYATKEMMKHTNEFCTPVQSQKEIPDRDQKTLEDIHRHTVVAMLKDCADQKDLEKGSRVHADLVRKGFLENDFFVGSALVTMYAKCGSLAKAQHVFDKLQVRNVILWNALISGYSQHGCGEDALNCYKQMQLEGIAPDAVTFVCILKACGSIGAIAKGIEIHDQVSKKGMLQRNVIVGTAVVDMYAKCGLLAQAQEVFDKLPIRNIVSWNALLAGYVQHGVGKEALDCFRRMQLEHVPPDAVTFICLLKACSSSGAVEKGRKCHGDILRLVLMNNSITLGATLVDTGTKGGALAKAGEVLYKFPVLNVDLWNMMIAGYAQHGFVEDALNCFALMEHNGVFPDSITFVCILKVCGRIGATGKGQEIHVEITKKGLLTELAVGNALIEMYTKCGSLMQAVEVFVKLPLRDVISWSTLIAGYVREGHGEDALHCFGQMQLDGVSPDDAVFICILKACGSVGAKNKGQEIHAKIAQKGLLKTNVVVGTVLVDMYAKLGLLANAQEVFDKLSVQNLGSWNVLIGGYVQHNCFEEALNCFGLMQLEGVSPDAVTFVSILKACGNIKARSKGKEIHDSIVREGWLAKDIVVGNALVDMYVKHGLLVKAQEVFDKLPLRNVVSWSTLITGYAQRGSGEQVLKYYEQMQVEGIFPNAVTFVSILKACGSMGAVEKGREVHINIIRDQLLEKNTLVGTALVDMYAKCGLLAKAQEVFDKIPDRDVVLWSTLITGYAQLGKAEDVFCTFDRMIEEGIIPNSVTFTSVLNACSNTGLVAKAQMYFESITKYGILPTLEHYTCMINLLCRVGQLDKALKLLMQMPFSDNLVVWLSVLGACQRWGNVELGRRVFEHAVQVDEKDPVAYVWMSNVYIDAGRKEDADKIEAMRLKHKAWKDSGYCEEVLAFSSVGMINISHKLV